MSQKFLYTLSLIGLIIAGSTSINSAVAECYCTFKGDVGGWQKHRTVASYDECLEELKRAKFKKLKVNCCPDPLMGH